MSNEKANEFLPWRGLLTPPDALPEQGLEEKEVTWQRLAERLQQNPRRRFAAWWIAAACFVLALLPVSHLFRNRAAHPSRIALRPSALRPAAMHAAAVHPSARLEPVTPPPSTPTPPATAAKSQAPVGGHPISTANYGEFAIIKKITRVRSMSSPHSNRISPSDHLSATAAHASLLIADTLKTTDPNPLLAANPLPAANPLLAANAPQPVRSDSAGILPRHILRIVYLNELSAGRTGLNSSTNTPTRQPAFLRLGTAAAGDGNRTASQTNDPIIKIGITSSNH